MKPPLAPPLAAVRRYLVVTMNIWIMSQCCPSTVPVLSPVSWSPHLPAPSMGRSARHLNNKKSSRILICLLVLLLLTALVLAVAPFLPAGQSKFA